MAPYGKHMWYGTLMLHFEILFSLSFLPPGCSNLPNKLGNKKILSYNHFCQNNGFKSWIKTTWTKASFLFYLSLNTIFFHFFWWNLSNFHSILILPLYEFSGRKTHGWQVGFFVISRFMFFPLLNNLAYRFSWKKRALSKTRQL